MTSTNWLIGGGMVCVTLFAAAPTVHAQFRPTVIRNSVITVEAQEIAQRELLRTAASSDMTQRIETALLQRRNWDYLEIRLDDLVKVFQKELQVPIFLDNTALQDEGVDPSTPLPEIRGTMTLNRFLELALQPLQLTHFIENGVLMITTQAKADEVLVLRIYPVLDLVRRDDADDYSSLMVVIHESTSGQWELIEGVGGTLTPLPATGSLFIRQTWKVHREIEGLLYAARKARQMQHIPSLSVNLDAGVSVPVGRAVITGSELTASPAIEGPAVISPPATASPATWRIPRVDRPRRAK
jgi:hypothetical protein